MCWPRAERCATRGRLEFELSAKAKPFTTGGIGPEMGEGGLFRIDLGVKGLVILPAKK